MWLQREKRRKYFYGKHSRCHESFLLMMNIMSTMNIERTWKTSQKLKAINHLRFHYHLRRFFENSSTESKRDKICFHSNFLSARILIFVMEVIFLHQWQEILRICLKDPLLIIQKGCCRRGWEMPIWQKNCNLRNLVFLMIKGSLGMSLLHRLMVLKE